MFFSELYPHLKRVLVHPSHPFSRPHNNIYCRIAASKHSVTWPTNWFAQKATKWLDLVKVFGVRRQVSRWDAMTPRRQWWLNARPPAARNTAHPAATHRPPDIARCAKGQPRQPQVAVQFGREPAVSCCCFCSCCYCCCCRLLVGGCLWPRACMHVTQIHTNKQYTHTRTHVQQHQHTMAVHSYKPNTWPATCQSASRSYANAWSVGVRVGFPFRPPAPGGASAPRHHKPPLLPLHHFHVLPGDPNPNHPPTRNSFWSESGKPQQQRTTMPERDCRRWRLLAALNQRVEMGKSFTPHIATIDWKKRPESIWKYTWYIPVYSIVFSLPYYSYKLGFHYTLARLWYQQRIFTVYLTAVRTRSLQLTHKFEF